MRDGSPGQREDLASRVEKEPSIRCAAGGGRSGGGLSESITDNVRRRFAGLQTVRGPRAHDDVQVRLGTHIPRQKRAGHLCTDFFCLAERRPPLGTQGLGVFAAPGVVCGLLVGFKVAWQPRADKNIAAGVNLHLGDQPRVGRRVCAALPAGLQVQKQPDVVGPGAVHGVDKGLSSVPLPQRASVQAHGAVFMCVGRDLVRGPRRGTHNGRVFIAGRPWDADVSRGRGALRIFSASLCILARDRRVLAWWLVRSGIFCMLVGDQPAGSFSFAHCAANERQYARQCCI